MANPICDYCGTPSKKVTGKDIYPHRHDLANKTFYLCKKCNAYVGCYPNTSKPLGRLANAELRKAKQQAHLSFDLLWKNKILGDRSDAYAYLAKKMGINIKQCHIGMFDVQQCKLVVKISKEAFYEKD